MKSKLTRFAPLLVAVAISATSASPVLAQDSGSLEAATATQSQSDQPVALTLDEAIQLALVKSYMLRDQRLDVDNAKSLVREGWGQLVPQIDASSGYTRNLAITDLEQQLDLSLR